MHQETQQHHHDSHGRYHETLKTIAGVAGNILEWYDFAVFGFFSDILGQVSCNI
jgi:hypothetical protein